MTNQTKDVESSIQHKLSSLPKNFSNHCIYKVPEHIRKVKEECYQPSIVSIGPIYYKNPSLTFSQELKLSHLQCFLEFSIHTNGNRHFSLAQHINLIKEREEEARSYYEETISLSSNEFIEMMMVDAAFIIYYFMCYSNSQVPLRRDPMINKIAWMMQVEQDLFLEDNQIPFFVLNNLYEAAFGAAYPGTSFKDVTSNFIGNTYLLGREAARTITGRERVRQASNIKHLVDFLRVCCLPSKLREQLNIQDDSQIIFSSSAKELKATGVTFVPIESESVLDITFSKGVLRIPTIIIQESTEAVLRSIVFFEQCHHYYNSYFIDYIFFLDSLINTSEDVRILVHHGIIKHCLGSDEEVTTFMNQITRCILLYNPNFYYADISRDLNAYATMRWNKWKAVLRRDYFNHPWSIISVIYLVFLLILTVLQVYTGFKG